MIKTIHIGRIEITYVTHIFMGLGIGYDPEDKAVVIAVPFLFASIKTAQ